MAYIYADTQPDGLPLKIGKSLGKEVNSHKTWTMEVPGDFIDEARTRIYEILKDRRVSAYAISFDITLEEAKTIINMVVAPANSYVAKVEAERELDQRLQWAREVKKDQADQRLENAKFLAEFGQALPYLIIGCLIVAGIVWLKLQGVK